MTPKEEAGIMVLQMYSKISGIPIASLSFVSINFQDSHAKTSKECALIAVNTVLDETSTESQIQYYNGEWSRMVETVYSNYWQQVKEEIEKL